MILSKNDVVQYVDTHKNDKKLKGEITNVYITRNRDEITIERDIIINNKKKKNRYKIVKKINN